MLESMFNENELKNIVKEKYGLEVIKSEKINRGSASITKIYTDKKEYVLKEFQEKYNKDFIIKEIDIVNFLSNRNMKVPVYIKCLDGKYYFEENERVVILQEYIDGYTIDNNKGNMDQVIESAKYLGMITKELESYDELWKWDVESWFTKDYLENAIKKAANSCNNLLELVLKVLSNVTNMSYIFSKCNSLLNISNISKWNISNIKDISYLFYVRSTLDFYQIFPIGI